MKQKKKFPTDWLKTNKSCFLIDHRCAGGYIARRNWKQIGFELLIITQKPTHTHRHTCTRTTSNVAEKMIKRTARPLIWKRKYYCKVKSVYIATHSHAGENESPFSYLQDRKELRGRAMKTETNIDRIAKKTERLKDQMLFFSWINGHLGCLKNS